MKLDPNLLNDINENSPAGSLIRLFSQYRKWLLIPVVICTFVAVAVAVLSQSRYSSRQTLVVRDDMVGSAFKPGRFESLESMKSAQETILEMARRPQVIRSALNRLGPPRGKRTDWINDEVIESTQGRIKISAPNGAEFGATEAIVLTVEQHTRERSRKFISFLLDEIEHSLRNFRSNRFRSMEQELAEAARIADESYLEAATRLKRFESDLGSDLGTLISLGDQNTGSSNILQTQISTLMVEQRKAQSDLDTVRKQIDILKEVADDPRQILEVPSELLQLLPTLDSLAKGLNDALLKYSNSIGTHTDNHPSAKADRLTIQTVKVQIKQKLSDSVAALEYQEELRSSKLARIDDLIASKNNRLSELSRMRVDYETLRTERQKKADVKGKASAKLADIQALGAAANEVNLFTRVDEPQVDVHPAGPSKKTVVLGGMLAGLFIGIGLVMLVAPIDNRPNGNESASPPRAGTDQLATRSPDSPAPVSQVQPEPGFRSQPESTPKPAPNPVSPVPPVPTRPASTPRQPVAQNLSAAKQPVATTTADSSRQSVPAISTPPVPQVTPASPVALNTPAPTRDDVRGPGGTISAHGLDEAIFNELTGQPTANTSPGNRPGPAKLKNQEATTSSSSKLPIPEKIRQLEKAETPPAIASETRKQPIKTGVPQAQPSAAVAAGTTNQLGTPQPTSKPTSANQIRGNQSAPRGEIQPDNRPAASKVNLKKIREQLKAKRSSQPDIVQSTLQEAEEASSIPEPVDVNLPPSGTGSGPVSKTAPASGVTPPPTNPASSTIVLGGGSGSVDVSAGPPTGSINVPEVPGNQQRSVKDESLIVDQHISDLANSIRDICQPNDTPDNPPAANQ